MAKNNGRNLMVLAVAAILALVLFNCMQGRKVSKYHLRPASLNPDEKMPGKYAPVQGSGKIDVNACALQNGGTGLASALLPREVATQENFGEFMPEDILKNQNFLDPREQIGFPETVGGNLRNANQQVRSEPPNPRNPVTIFNVSTIVPDQMRPNFELGGGLA